MTYPIAKFRITRGLRIIINAVLLTVMLFSTITVLAATYNDGFGSRPADLSSGGDGEFNTGTSDTGLNYLGSPSDLFTWEGTAEIGLDASFSGGGTGSFTITSRDGKSFVFNSLDWKNDGGAATTIAGEGPEPFTIDVGAVTPYTTYIPDGGSKLVTQVTISSSDMYALMDNVSVELDVPGAALYGNSTLIVNGDDTPDSADDTDLGSTPAGTPVTSTFTINNIGDVQNLTISNASVTGAGFSITQQPGTPVTPGASTTFDVQFDPAGGGVVDGTVTITNNSEASPYTFTVRGEGTADTDPPDVSSIVRANTNPTNAATVNFTVTFDESVTGVDASDFSLDISGVSGASIGTVTGSGTTWNVPVNTGAGDGTVSIDLVDDDSIADGAANPLGGAGAGNGNYTAGEAYTIDKTTPTISIGAPSATDTNTGPVTYTVTYTGADAVTLANGNVTLNTTGNANGTVNVTGSGTATRTVTISSITGDGTLGITIAAGTASDNAGNTALGAGPSTTFNVDNTAPTVTSISRDTPPVENTNADTVTFEVVFSESVTNVGTADFSVSGPTGASIGVTGSGTTYDVTISGGDMANLNATVDLGFEGGQDIADTAGNDLTNTTPGTEETYTLDNTAPTVTSISRDTPPVENTNADTVTFEVVFSESVTNVGTADFSVSGPTGASIGVTGSGTTYDVTISGGDMANLNATVDLGFEGGQDIADTAGNDLTNTTPGTEETYTLDNTVAAPSTPDLTDASDTGTLPTDNITMDTTPQFTGTCENGATVTLTSSVDSALTPTDVCSGGSYDITTTLTENVHNVTAVQVDVAGNTSSASGPLSVTVDTTDTRSV